MSSEHLMLPERNASTGQEIITDAGDEAEKTPKLEAPIAVEVTTPSGTEQSSGQSTADNDYFTANPAAVEQQAEWQRSYNSSISPSVSESDLTAAGHIELPDTLSELPAPDRPAYRSAQSNVSVSTVSSAATVTAATSAPALIDASKERPPYPNQSYAALHHQQYPTPHPPPLLKQRTAHPGQIATFTSALASLHQSGSRTAGNSPAITPSQGLFNPQAAISSEWEPPATPGTYASPFLHFTQRVPPKETHIADVDVDPVSGRKLINHYEIIDELGRGTHGKVKLGRDLTTDSYVAIKIVERYSRRRKLGRLGTTEDKVMKEVAILKQARHPNVVALLEVIDDPSRKKVYIVLEWVERGEIQWRAKGPNEIAIVEMRRYERERAGPVDARQEAEDAAVLAEAQRRLAKHRRRQQRAFRQMRRDVHNDPSAWSNEMAGDESSDMSDDDRLSRVSTESFSNSLRVANLRRASRTPSPLPPHPEVITPTANHPMPASASTRVTSEPLSMSPTTSKKDFGEYTYTGLEGTMYGAYIPGSSDASRASSLANSIHSSGSLSKPYGSAEDLFQRAADVLDGGLDQDLEYVPMMTVQQCRVAFRDTLLGLQYLHYQGIVHRDIKPPNLLATKDHRVKISDFGVSHLGKPISEGETGEGVSEHETQDLADEAKELAKTVGTPAFYAPELCISDSDHAPLPVTKAIDVWALGITLFCMLYARTPFVDNEYVVMRQIADEEITIPRRRLKPVDTKARSRPSSQGRANPPLATGRRHPYELDYEDIGEDLHDLMKRLLTKDPRKRITLEEVRHHPWVVEDLQDKLAWLEETDPNRQSQGKKIEVSKEDVSAAVVPLFLDRVRSGVKKFLGERLGLTTGVSSKPASRGRASSNAASASGAVSPAPSNASSGTSASRESRRQSLRGDEPGSHILSALKTSRESDHHPLSRSVAASPEVDRQEPYFDDPVRPESALGAIEDSDQTPLPRPFPPERAITTMPAASMRTVRQSDFRRSRHEESPPPSPGLPGTPTAVDTASSVLGSGGWGSGVARRILKSVRERSTAGSARARSSDRGSNGSVDTHGEPSVALSQTNAAGHVNLPHELDEQGSLSAVSSAHNSPSASRPLSLLSSASRERLSPRYAEAGTLSRTGSAGSVSSTGRKAPIVPSASNSYSPTTVKRIPPASSTEDWERATDEHVRKLIRERDEEEHETHNSYIDRTCPPSPDDQRPRQDAPSSRRVSHFDISSPDSQPAETSPTRQDPSLPAPELSSMSDLGSTSTVSASMSNPSIPSVISRASSVDPTDAIPPTVPEKVDLMSSDDTLNPKTTRFQEEATDEGYTADDNVLNSDEDDEEYDDSSDSDGGLVMSRRRSATKAFGDSAKERRGTGLSVRSKKSSRSGSSNTMKKVRTRDSEDERQRPSDADISEA